MYEDDHDCVVCGGFCDCGGSCFEDCTGCIGCNEDIFGAEIDDEDDDLDDED